MRLGLWAAVLGTVMHRSLPTYGVAVHTPNHNHTCISLHWGTKPTQRTSDIQPSVRGGGAEHEFSSQHRKEFSNTVNVKVKQRFVYIKSYMDSIIIKEHHNDNNHSLQTFGLFSQEHPNITSSNTMADAAFVEALGLIGTTMGIIQFSMDHFAPAHKDVQGTIVNIKAGNGLEKGASNTLVSTRVMLLDLPTLSRSKLTPSNRVARSLKSMPTSPVTTRLEPQANRPWLATAITSVLLSIRMSQVFRVSILGSKTARTLPASHGLPSRSTTTLQMEYGPGISDERMLNLILLCVVYRLTV
jgi:hypothetical protein